MIAERILLHKKKINTWKRNKERRKKRGGEGKNERSNISKNILPWMIERGRFHDVMLWLIEAMFWVLDWRAVKYRWYIESMFWGLDWRQWSTGGTSSHVLNAGLTSFKYRWSNRVMFWGLDWRQLSTDGSSSLCFEDWIDVSEVQVVHRVYVLNAGLTSFKYRWSNRVYVLRTELTPVKYRWYIESMFWGLDWRQ